MKTLQAARKQETMKEPHALGEKAHRTFWWKDKGQKTNSHAKVSSKPELITLLVDEYAT